MRLPKSCAPVLLAALLLSAPCLAGPVLNTLSPEDKQKNQLGAFSIIWATAGIVAAFAAQQPEADAAALFFSGRDFTGIDTLRRRGFTALGTIDEVVAGGAGIGVDGSSSSSVFVGNTGADSTGEGTTAVAPSPDVALVTAIAVPRTEIASKPVEPSRTNSSGGRPAVPPGVGTRPADHPATVPPEPIREPPHSMPGAPFNGGQPAVKVSNSSNSTNRSGGQAMVPGAPSRVFNSAGVTEVTATQASPEAAAKWLLANLVARNNGFASGQLRERQQRIESFMLPRALAWDESGTSRPGSNPTVVLPVAPLKSLDTALGANVRIYRNSPSGTATTGRLGMAMQTLQTLSGPQIISIAISVAGLSGLFIVWRRWRKREALAYRIES